MNIVAFFHAYKFTHFVTEKVAKTKSPEKLKAGYAIGCVLPTNLKENERNY